MKIIFVSLFLIITTGNVFSQGKKRVIDDKYGFRDIKLETRIDSIPKLILTEDHGRTKYFHRNMEDLSLGDKSLKEIVYIFYDSTLYQILVKTDGIINSLSLLDMLSLTYGEGYKANQFLDAYLWQGRKTQLYFRVDPISRDGLLLIRSKIIDELVQRDEKEVKSNASKSIL